MPRDYEIPVSSQENLTSLGIDSTSSFQATSQPTSYNSSSGVEITTIPNSCRLYGTSATNQMFISNAFQNVLTRNSTSSLRDIRNLGRVHTQGSQPSSTTFHRVSGNNSPNGSTGSLSPNVMKQALMAQFQSTDGVTNTRRRESNCSEAPPPYRSRRSSEQILDVDSDNSSMIYNSAYERFNHRLYQESNLSEDSIRNAYLRYSPSPNANTTISERTRQHAIQNERIRHHPPNHRVSSDVLSIPIRRQSRDQNAQGSDLISTRGATTCSTLC